MLRIISASVPRRSASPNASSPIKLTDEEIEARIDEEQKLDLSGVRLTKFPRRVFGRVDTITFLNLSGCTFLTKLSPEICQLKNLQHLNLSNCSRLLSLPPELGALKELLHLDLANCWWMMQLPSEMSALQKLEHLNLSGCTNLNPQGMGSLLNLKYLDLTECASAAEHHRVQDRQELLELPNELGQLQKLETLIIRTKRLMYIPECIMALKSLKQLELGHCSHMTTLPPEISRFKNLTKLALFGAFRLVSLPPEMGALVNLQELDLFKCLVLTKLPLEVLTLPNLIKVDVRWCAKLTTTPKEMFQHSYSLLEVVTRDDKVKSEFEYEIRLNKAGRRLLREDVHDVPTGLWSFLLGRVSNDPSVLQYFLTEKPDLVVGRGG